MGDSRALGPTSGQHTQAAKHLASEAPYEVIPSNRPSRSEPGRVLSDLMLSMRDVIVAASCRNGRLFTRRETIESR